MVSGRGLKRIMRVALVHALEVGVTELIARRARFRTT